MKKLYLFFLLLFFTFKVASAQTATTQSVDFSCPGQVTVTYDLKTNCATDVVLYYSHNKYNWLPASTVTGDLKAQTSPLSYQTYRAHGVSVRCLKEY